MAEYSRPLKFPCYDIEEILIEKVRAILTRRGYKARDFVDIHLIEEHAKIHAKDYLDDIVVKTEHTLKNYEKYRRNLAEKGDLLRKGQIFQWGDEKAILLRPIDEKRFYSFLDGFHPTLMDVLGRLGA
jgi:hypothetical protein